MKIKNAPKEIYLVVGELPDAMDDEKVDFNELSEVTWCVDKTSKNDIKYVKECKKELSSLEKFQKLSSIKIDGETYTAQLYEVNGSWIFDYLSQDFHKSIARFDGRNIDEAISRAYEWADAYNLVKED